MINSSWPPEDHLKCFLCPVLTALEISSSYELFPRPKISSMLQAAEKRKSSLSVRVSLEWKLPSHCTKRMKSILSEWRKFLCNPLHTSSYVVNAFSERKLEKF